MTVPKKFKLKNQLLARFTVCVDTDTYNQLTSMARRKKLPRSTLVRNILVNYMAQLQKPPTQPPVESHVGTQV